MVSIIRKSNLLLNNKQWFVNHLKSQFNRKPNQLMRSFGKKSMPESQINMKSLIKPFVFTIGFSGTAFAFCTVWNYERTIVFRRKVINNWNSQWSQTTHRKKGQLRDELNKWWNTRSEGFKLFSAIALVNGLVFIGWKIPRLQTFMSRHFMTNMNTNTLKCWPMFFSTFSHYSATHLILNMVVIKSFSDIGVHLFGIEQFLALYLSSGVISSFASYLYKVIAVRTSASLGASGAIMGILSSCCIARPDMQLVIIFLPFFTISSGIALKGIMLMDSMGLIFKWRFFDHAAHLGGALFGIWYVTSGQNFLWNNCRIEVQKVWQQIRNKWIK